MKTISEIEKDIKSMRKKYHEGYSDIIKYMSEFRKDELDYIEVTEKAGIESFKRLSSFKDIFTLVISLFALAISSMPESVKNDVAFLGVAEMSILALGAIFLLMYFWIDKLTSQCVDIKFYILEVIQKVRGQ